MLRAYEKWTPRGSAAEMVSQAVQIASDYAVQGYDLTLRQLYYQFVSRDLLSNEQRSYKRLGDVLNRARLAGYVDWDSIVDRTRSFSGINSWESPEQIVSAVAEQYKIDLWADQDVAVEVWVEKEALAGVIGRTSQRERVGYFSCRGYVSQSALWQAGQRHLEHIRNGRSVLVLHLGDHDPSGIDMTRDIRDRLNTFLLTDWLYDEMPGVTTTTRSEVLDSMRERQRSAAEPHEVRRIALNMDQIEQYGPPPNPAKLTDSRSESYVREHGYESWELDALDPSVLDGLITEHIEDVVDLERMEQARRRENAEADQLQMVSDNWDYVVQAVG